MIGERIKSARVAKGLSLRQLAEAVGNVSHAAIAKYEKGHDIPSSGVLLRLAKTLGVRMEYFLRPISVVLTEAEYRKGVCLNKKYQRQVIAEISEWLERYLEVEKLLGLDIVPYSTPEHVDCNIGSEAESERVADELRCAWELGTDAIENLTELLEEKGIKVGLIPNRPGFDGCTLQERESGPVIAITKDTAGDRQRFTLAHELAHIILKPGPGVNVERAAHRFAGAFLAPASEVQRELGGKRTALSVFELHMLKHKYGLSMQAWIYRAKDLGVITEVTANKMFKDFRARGYHKKEPGDQLPPTEPRRLQRLVFRAISEGIISERRASELLGKDIKLFISELQETHGNISDMGY